VPDACEDEVYTFFIKRSKNINANVPLGVRAGAAAGALPRGLRGRRGGAAPPSLLTQPPSPGPLFTCRPCSQGVQARR
jgi:hypothetical protein